MIGVRASRRRGGPRGGRLTLALAIAWSATAWPAAAQGPAAAQDADPLAGARTLGDPFYPTLGNGGYDTLAVDLRVDWSRPDAVHPTGSAEVVTALDLVATMDLGTLTLDLAPRSVRVTGVTVDGEPAVARQDAADRKLTVVLPVVRAPGDAFRVVVAAEATPGPVPRLGEDTSWRLPGLSPEASRARLGRGLIADGEGGVLLAAQPNGAHTLFPVNDHPLDKATYRITLTAPPGMTGIATGSLASTSAATDGSVTTSWVATEPVASHVVALGIGDRVVRSGPVVGGVTHRSAMPTDVEPIADAVLGELPGLVAWLEEAIGVTYPFDAVGLLAYAGSPTTAILEGQTLPIVPASLFSPFAERCQVMGTLVHELAHQWFGNAVSVARWDEKWLSEGHATWYEWRWQAEHGCLDDELATPGASPIPSPAPSADPADALEVRLHRAYREAGTVRATQGPPSALAGPAAAYTAAVYDQGALALGALRAEIGERAFQRLQRVLVRRHAGGSLTTDGFIALASRVAGRDLGAFLGAWLRGPAVPPMPGRPDWTTAAPAPSPAPSPTQADRPRRR